MLTALNPPSLPKPRAPYSHGIVVGGDARWLYISGQISTEETFELQVHSVWKNLMSVLIEAGMSVADLVSIRTYLTDQKDVAAYSAIRSSYLGDARPTSTLVVVSALARPELKVEVEAVAAQMAGG